MWKKFHIFALLVLLSSGISYGQTRDDKLPKDKIKVSDTRKLRRVSGYYAEDGENPRFQEWDLSMYLPIIRYSADSIVDTSKDRKTVTHEWNHYKNYMFGVKLPRKTIEDAFVLSSSNEILSWFAHTLAEWPEFDQIMKERPEFLKLVMEKFFKDGGAARPIIKSEKYSYDFYRMAKKQYQPDTKEEYSTEEILRDMLVFYFDDGTVLDMNSYITAEWFKNEILSIPEAKAIINIIREETTQKSGKKGQFSDAGKTVSSIKKARSASRTPSKNSKFRV
jgi:hypothetical protein